VIGIWRLAIDELKEKGKMGRELSLELGIGNSEFGIKKLEG
jgi:hypothetical protein